MNGTGKLHWPGWRGACSGIGLLAAAMLAVLVAAAVGQEEAPAPEGAADVPAEAAPPEPASGTEQKGQPLVTNMFYETSIRQALADMAAQTATIIVPDMSVQGIVTCELKDVPLDKALEIVLSAGNFEFRHEDGYILVGSTSLDSPSFARMCEAQAVKLDYVKAKQTVQMLPKPFQDYVKADEETNTVCVTAPPNLLAKLVKDIRMLDVPLRQVLIEARVVELEKRGLERFGTSWGWECEHGAMSFDPVSWTLGLAYSTSAEFTRSLGITLELLRQNQSATIVANPHVVAADGTEAEIKVTTEEYYEIVTEDVYVRSELQVIESGIILTMLPRIGKDGDITMKVTPEVSNVVGQGTKGLPVITRRKASTTVHVQDGGTVIIGGLLDSRTRTEELKVPLLGDIPVLGWLFRRETAEDQGRQVAVFITPRIVEEPVAGHPLLAAQPYYRPQFEPAGAEFQEDLERLLKGPDTGR